MDQLFDLSQFAFPNLIDVEKPWLSLEKMDKYIDSNRKELIEKGFREVGPALIHPNANVDPSVVISEPSIIDLGTQVCKNAFLRGSVIIGKNSFIGQGIEIKHSIIMDSTRIPHLNYIADSIIGSHVNFGAGTITANWKGGWDNKIISVKISKEKISTGLEKFGALIGDQVYLGANNVTAPGTIIGRNVLTYPLCFLRNTIPANSIVKNKSNIEIVTKQ